MSSNLLSEALEPDFQTVFDVLANEQCRTMLKNLNRPKTAGELTSTCDLPRSTVYRKLEQMVDAGLFGQTRRREIGDEIHDRLRQSRRQTRAEHSRVEYRPEAAFSVGTTLGTVVGRHGTDQRQLTREFVDGKSFDGER